jgi:hypothetical protein
MDAYVAVLVLGPSAITVFADIEGGVKHRLAVFNVKHYLYSIIMRDLGVPSS